MLVCQNFSVHFKQLDRSKRKTVVGRVHVDGSYVGGKVFGTVPPHDSDSHTVERMRIGATVARILQFSALSLCGALPVHTPTPHLLCRR